MPQLGESVTEGTIGHWLKRVGEHVEKYEPIVEVTTDKVNAEVPSPLSGTLTALLAEEGQTLRIGEAICEIASDEGEEPSPEETAPAKEADVPASAASPSPSAPQRPASAQNRVRTSPLVRRLAQDAGVDLQIVPGTGSEGRVTREDLSRYLSAPSAPAVPIPPASPVRAASAHDTFLDISPMRRAIAEHMLRSKNEAPQAITWFEVDMSPVVALRKRIRAEFEAREGVPLTYLPFVLKAAVECVKEYPVVNSSWGGDQIIVHRPVHVGIAVAVPDGLIVPVLRNADSLSLAGIAHGADDLITRARAGRLGVEDVQGGTFTVNNPGSYGSVLSAPILNHPQAAILSMEAIVKRPVVVEGDAIAVRSMMFLSFAFDHRVFDGAVATQYLGSLKARLESMGPQTEVF